VSQLILPLWVSLPCDVLSAVVSEADLRCGLTVLLRDGCIELMAIECLR
jgi:hypothetical protein